VDKSVYKPVKSTLDKCVDSSVDIPLISGQNHAEFRAALFDLDGTLIDTLADLAYATNAMRTDLGLAPLDRALIGTYIGKGVVRLVERALSGPDGRAFSVDEREQALVLFRDHYLEVNGREAVLYPGVREGLQAFAAMGLKLGLVTNKLAQYTPPLLQQTGLAAFFSCVVCGDTCARAKPDPEPVLYACHVLGVEPAHSVMIGDSINDVQAARAAGVAALAVSYGYNEGMDVDTLDVDAIVPSIEHAARWVAQRQSVSL